MGEAVKDLARDLSEWSQATFGTDLERGPIGAVRHLQKEAGEVERALLAGESKERVTEELADCLILVIDASRRHGVKPMELFKAAYAKLQVNRGRKWPKPTSDEPVEHVREPESAR